MNEDAIDSMMAQEEATIHDVGTERFFLASLISKPEAIVRAASEVPVDWIFNRMNRYIYNSMLFIYKNAGKYDWQLKFDAHSMLFAAQHLGPSCRESFIQKTNGMSAIHRLEELATNIDVDMKNLVGALRDTATRVQSYRKAREVQLSAIRKDSQNTGRDVVSNAEAIFAGIVQNYDRSSEGVIHLGDKSSEFADKCYLARDHKDIFYVPSLNFPYLMNLMGGGFQKGGLTVMGARTKVGKSTFLLNLALQVAVLQKLPVLFLDSEMSWVEMISRASACLSGISERALLSGSFYSDKTLTDRFNQAQQAVIESPLYYANIAGQNFDSVRSHMLSFKSRNVSTSKYRSELSGKEYEVSSPALVIYDWMKFTGTDANSNDAEHIVLGKIASRTKDMAEEMKVPIVAGAQLNRNAVGATPEQWEDEGEKFIAASDRISNFCTSLCALRWLTRTESASVQEGLPYNTDEEIERNRLKYNQKLHVFLQRGGSPYQSGIPMHLHCGTQKYTEMIGDSEVQAFMESSKDYKEERKGASYPPRMLPKAGSC